MFCFVLPSSTVITNRTILSIPSTVYRQPSRLIGPLRFMWICWPLCGLQLCIFLAVYYNMINHTDATLRINEKTDNKKSRLLTSFLYKNKSKMIVILSLLLTHTKLTAGQRKTKHTQKQNKYILLHLNGLYILSKRAEQRLFHRVQIWVLGHFPARPSDIVPLRSATGPRLIY